MLKRTKSGMRGFVLSLIVLFFLSPCAGPQAENANGLIAPRDAHKLLTSDESLLLLDVRTAEEFRSGHLEEAVNIPVAEFANGAFKKKLANVGKQEPVLVYCRTGRRSGIARRILVEEGYSNIRDLQGGILVWEKAGLPVVRQPAEPQGGGAGEQIRSQEDASS